MDEEKMVEWLKKEVLAVLNSPADMGAIEKALDRACMEIRRKALELIAKESAKQAPFVCPECNERLNAAAYNRKRTVNAAFGKISYERDYGFCPLCLEYFYPADLMLGMAERATASPRIQECCSLMALHGPAGRLKDDLRRLTGIDICTSTIHREARRQGDRALLLRDIDEQLTQSSEGIAMLSSRANTSQTPFTLIIEIDAWNIRERDNWGKTKKLRLAGKDTERWHWVYTGTVFRLDQRGTTASGRPVISERGYVATRKGIESFQRQLYAEALQRGLSSAKIVLIIADGAVWIWRLADDRFKGAIQQLDLYHAEEHLWNLAHELYGHGSLEATEWVKPYINWLKNRKDGALDVISNFKQMHKTIENITEKQQEAIEREVNYFTEHKDRMDYKTAKSLGHPLGSGAIESTCSQYQRRFKLTGQFWSLAGDEAFLALSTIHRNNRWHQLFPHDTR